MTEEKIKKIENILCKTINDAGYSISKVALKPSSRPDLGDYQINECMALAKKVGTNPRAIAANVVKVLQENPNFTNVNIAGPGFINITISNISEVERWNILFCVCFC